MKKAISWILLFLMTFTGPAQALAVAQHFDLQRALYLEKQAIAHNSDYGETTQTSGDKSLYQPFLYTGQEMDAETGWYHNRARHYAPKFGKFLARDPIASANLYQYCGGDPINFSDPSGNNPILFGLAVIGLYSEANYYFSGQAGADEMYAKAFSKVYVPGKGVLDSGAVVEGLPAPVRVGTLAAGAYSSAPGGRPLGMTGGPIDTSGATAASSSLTKGLEGMRTVVTDASRVAGDSTCGGAGLNRITTGPSPMRVEIFHEVLHGALVKSGFARALSGWWDSYSPAEILAQELRIHELISKYAQRPSIPGLGLTARDVEVNQAGLNTYLGP